MSTREEINSEWKDDWVTERHPWHMQNVHPYLKLYFEKFTGGDVHGKRIWIPLCGASHDLFWLYQQGLEVVGVEVSEVAVKKFFSELNLSYTVEDVSPTCKQYIYDERLKIIQCDFFEVDLEVVGGPFDFWWDRGGLVAMVPEEQQKYITHNKLLLRFGGCCLLECFEYDRTVRSGPPHSFYPDELRILFGDSFGMVQLGKVASEDLPEDYNSGTVPNCSLVFYLLTSV